MPAQPLTDEQKADAARLRALFKKWQADRKDKRLPASQAEAAHLLGLGFGQSAFSQYLRGDIPLNVRVVAAFVVLLRCLPEEISPVLAAELQSLAAADKHISVSSDSAKKIHKSGLFSDSNVKPAHNTDVEPRERFDKNVTPAPVGERRIPVISFVQAGMMTEAVDPYSLGQGFETILTDLDVSEQTFALIIEGDSMTPEFNPQDKVIIDPGIEPRPGDFVVAKNTEEEATFKKYRPRGTGEHGQMMFELVPLNDDYPTLHSERDHLRIIGVMVEHRKYRRR